MTELEPGTRRCPTALVFTFTMMLAIVPTLAHGSTPPAAATAALTAAPSIASDPLRIEVEPSIDDAHVILGWIQERHPSVAEEIPSIEGHAQWIAVTIAGATYDYRVTVAAFRDGEPLGTLKEPVVCECNSEALLDLVDVLIDEELAVLRAAPMPEALSDREKAQPVTGTVDFREPSSSPTDRLWASPTGKAGVAVGVLGTGSLTVGIWLAVRSTEIRGSTPGRIETRPIRDAGTGLAVAGGVVLAAGMSMLVVDLVRQRKRQVAIVPVLDHRELGVAITWKARGRVGR